MKISSERFLFLQRPLQKIKSHELLSNPISVGVLLLVVTAVCYGAAIRYLGFFWDSWPMNWIAQTRGNTGLAQYFATNRPVWGLLYQVTTSILGGEPFAWQIFALVLRWMVAMELWWLFRLLWPRQTEPALWASLFFIVYPGFQQHSIGFLYSHFYLVMGAFAGSLICSLAAWQKPRWRIPIFILGILLSLTNLLMMEYFFLLELLRPFILWLASRDEISNKKTRLAKVLFHWGPYLAGFAGAGIWRAFFFPYTTNNYQMSILTQLASQPLQTLAALIQRMAEEIWISLGQVWIHAVEFPTSDSGVVLNILRWVGFMVIFGVGLYFIGLLFFSRVQPTRKENLQWAWQSLGLGAIAVLLAGWPFLLTNMTFSLDFAFDRFTLPFIFGACLLWSGLIMLLPWRPARWLILVVLVTMGAGFQYKSRLAFYQDWVSQQQFFWQLKWRVPNLKPGTAIVANETKATAFSTDNSLSAPLNWIYDPDNHSEQIRYLLVYPTIRVNASSSFKVQKDVPFKKDFLVGTFEGNTSQSITVYYDGTTCLRVVDPTIDSGNPLVSDELRTTAAFGDLSRIQPLPAGQKEQPPLPAILGQPPKNSWCEIYEKADLLRQNSQWYNILDLWKEGKKLASQSNFAAEVIPFVEAYARTGQWDEAARLTVNTQKSRADFCWLWRSLDRSTPASPDKPAAVRSAMDLLRCSEYGILPDAQ